MLTPKRLSKGAMSRLSRCKALLQTKFGTRRQHCNSCDSPVAYFYSYGGFPWGCPLCRSSTRERLVLKLIDEGVLPIEPTATNVLHVAPSEKGIIRHFSTLPGYHPVDLFPELYPDVKTERMDLMQLNSEARYDIAYLSHIMEHVPDDSLVFSNLHRALKSGGEAWILVPLWDKPSVDGSENMSSMEREKEFGQWDHVRQYGEDIADRMRAAGFDVTINRATDLAGNDFDELGLFAGDVVFRGCKK